MDKEPLTVYPNERAMMAEDRIKATRKRGAGNWLAFLILAAIAVGALVWADGYQTGKAEVTSC